MGGEGGREGCDRKYEVDAFLAWNGCIIGNPSEAGNQLV